MEDKILNLIKEYKRIIIARHIGGDPDALGSTFALKEIILENFPDKEVYVAGTSISRFKFFGTHDKITDEMYEKLAELAYIQKNDSKYNAMVKKREKINEKNCKQKTYRRNIIST